jgi:hypothetical protein
VRVWASSSGTELRVAVGDGDAQIATVAVEGGRATVSIGT